MGTKLYVGNLSWNVSDADLRSHFEAAGKVVSASVVSDRETGRSRGFGFVEMGSQEDATNAIGKFDSQEFQGRNLQVNEARPKEDRGGSQGSQGFRGPREYRPSERSERTERTERQERQNRSERYERPERQEFHSGPEFDIDGDRNLAGGRGQRSRKERREFQSRDRSRRENRRRDQWQ